MPLESMVTTPTGRALGVVTALALAGTLGVMGALLKMETALPPEGGVVAFELAWTPGRVEALRQAWGPAGERTVRASILLDFVLIPCYALGVAGLTLALARRASGRRLRAGLWLVLAPLVAGALDVLENVTLLTILAEPGPSPAILPGTAALAASIKFALLGLCGLYWLTSALAPILPTPDDRRDAGEG